MRAQPTCRADTGMQYWAHDSDVVATNESSWKRKKLTVRSNAAPAHDSEMAFDAARAEQSAQVRATQLECTNPVAHAAGFGAFLAVRSGRSGASRRQVSASASRPRRPDEAPAAEPMARCPGNDACGCLH